jgi:hypothetical protein
MARSDLLKNRMQESLCHSFPFFPFPVFPPYTEAVTSDELLPKVRFLISN